MGIEDDPMGVPLSDMEIIHQDVSKGGALQLTVWRQPTTLEEVMVNDGADGVVRVYDVLTGELLFEEAMKLSLSAIFGPGPSQEEGAYFEELAARHLEEN